MTPEIAVDRNDDGQAVIGIPPTDPMTALEAEEFMCRLIDAICLARELDGDRLPT
jgi:hypothetical protein